MVLMLAMMMAGQVTPDALRDMEFTLAVEETVMGMAPQAAPPEPFRTLIRMAGAHCWSCREIASKKLQAASKDDRRWLCWGRRSKDPEVRLRCNAALRRLFPCPDCDGTGRSKYYEDNPCWGCQGFRTRFLWSMWD